MPVEIQIEGTAALRRILERLEVLPDGLEPAVDEANQLLLEELRDYPPKLPNQRYVRTFRLRDSWQPSRIMREGTLGRVWGDIAYNQWVMDERFQAAIHQGRWQTVQRIARDEALQQQVSDIFERRLQAMVDGREPA